MLRKLGPLEKKISTVFNIKRGSSKHSMKSTDSVSSFHEEVQQSIPNDVRTLQHPHPAYIAVVSDENPQNQRLEEQINKALDSKADQSHADTINARYHRAMGDASPQLKRNVVHQEEEEKPLNAGSLSSSDSDFDWNETDESELNEYEREERKERKIRQVKGHEKNENLIRQAKRLRKVYLFLMTLSRPLRTTVIALLGSGIAITPSALIISRFPNSSVKNHVLVWSIWLSISFAATCATYIVVDTIPSVVIKLFNLFYGSTPEKLKTQVELWMTVRFWTKVALDLTWYWVILVVIFSRAFNFYRDSSLDYFEWIMKVFSGLFAAGVVLLAEKILLQIIQLNFHKISLKDRLQENERALWALDCLAAAKGVSHSPKKRNSKFLSNLNPNRAKIEGKMPRLRDSTVIDVPLTPKANDLNDSQAQCATQFELAKDKPMIHQEKETVPMAQKKQRRRSSHFSMFADQLAVAISNAALKDPSGSMTDAVVSRHSAKKLAKKLFQGLDEDRGGVITRNEFEPYFKTASDSAMAFSLFDKDGNGDIDRKEMRNAVTRIYRERSALANGLKAMSSAVAKLDAVLISIAFILIIFVWLFIFNPKETSSQLVPMATIILGFSFVFGNAAKNLFESMLFIFSVHPYDIGDMVLIDAQYMYVIEFGLFSTTFQRVDGQVLVAPHSILSSKKHILNIRRSGAMWETTELMVGFDTPLEVLHEFRTRLRSYVAANPREWKGGLDVNIDFIQNQNLIQLIIAMEHKSNWQDWGARWDRRTSLMKEIKKILDSLNIVYKLPVQPVSFVSRKPRNRGAPVRPVGTPLGLSSISHHGQLLDRLPPLTF